MAKDDLLKNQSDKWKSWPPDQFLYALHQELRNPLLVIKGYVEILSDEKAREFHPMALESISNSVMKIEEIADYILEYTRTIKSTPNL